MAGDWIPMRINLTDDPDVLAIATTLNLDEFAVVGRLHRLWAWANEHTADGVVRKVGAAWVDKMTSCPGFADAMASVGWLHINAVGIKFPKFDTWNSKGAKSRLEETERKRKQRQKSGHGPDIVLDVSGICPEIVPSLTGQKRDQRREEERREENSASESCQFSEKGGGETASPGINPVRNTIDLGLLWCFRTRAVGRKPTAQQVTDALDAMIAAGSITLEGIRTEWTSETMDWSQTFGNWRTSLQRANERRVKSVPATIHNGKPITIRGGPEIRGEEFNPHPNRCIDDYEDDHANFDPSTGKYFLWVKTCKKTTCERKECVEARRHGK